VTSAPLEIDPNVLDALPASISKIISAIHKAVQGKLFSLKTSVSVEKVPFCLLMVRHAFPVNLTVLLVIKLSVSSVKLATFLKRISVYSVVPTVSHAYLSNNAYCATKNLIWWMGNAQFQRA